MIYVNIPFCRRKCAYCNFKTFTSWRGLENSYTTAVLKEISICNLKTGPIETIYFGGGNPLLINVVNLAAVIQAVEEKFSISPAAEITLEANPEDVTLQSLGSCRNVGFNRLSLGIQSFNDESLRFLRRRHTAASSWRALEKARRSGFANINIDLIFGLPGQSVSSWRRELRQAAAAGVDHISVYGLSLETGTELYRLAAAGELNLPSEDEQADMMDWAHGYLQNQGYRHYEIANFARPGYECRHNLNYWRGGDYLGFGAGACGCVDGKRRYNLSSPRMYIEKVAAGFDPVAEVENLNQRQRLSESLFLGLRLVDGFSTASLERRFACNLNKMFKKQLANLTNAGLMEAGARWRLTDKGRLVADEVMSEFV